MPAALRAGAVAAVISGLLSTLHAFCTGRSALEASLAAGTVLLRHERCVPRLLAAGGLLHGCLSLGWALLLAATLPARRAPLIGGLAGAVIAAVDLGLVGRRFPRIRALPVLPQVADHLAYGAAVGWVLGRRRHGHRADLVSVRAVPAAPADVFAFLADLRNHWLLEDHFVELGGLDEDEGAGPRGGRVRLKGPLGIGREARTRVLSARPPLASQAGWPGGPTSDRAPSGGSAGRSLPTRTAARW